MKGYWVFVCGASGAGKDSVMQWAENYLANQQRIVFSRRQVTRPAATGSDHDELSVTDFINKAATGGFAWRWQAHGFHYGIDAQYAQQVAAGHIVVVNGSREHAVQLDRNEPVRLVQIALDPAEIKSRLIARGRESMSQIESRLARNVQFATSNAHCTIVNNGALATAGKALADYLEWM